MFSYSRKNNIERAAFVGNIRTIEGVDVFYDQQDLNLGDEVHKSLSDMLNEADCLIALLTKESLASKEVLDEVIRSHERGKDIIPIVANDISMDSLPWFIREKNFIKYESTKFDTVFVDLRIAIEKKIKTSTSRKITPSANTYSWEEWWIKILEISRIIKTGVDNGHFNPSVILGISNGGLAVADHIKRQIFPGAKPPVLSLWADRWSSKKYFDNEYNNALFQAIKESNQNDPIELLLIDDAIRSSHTIMESIQFIQSKLGKDVKIVFVPLLSRDTSQLTQIEEYLPFSYENGQAFMINKADFYSLIVSSKSFPYKIF